jgi:DNA-binding transcriptional MerR regulator
VDKSPDAFRTISEVAEDLDLPQHVLRFWETRFAQIKPLKRGGGRRYYRPDDVELLKGIRHLLYSEGYTIKGLQRILKERGNRFVMDAGAGRFDRTMLTTPAGTSVAPPAAQGGGILSRFIGERGGERSNEMAREHAPVHQLSASADRSMPGSEQRKLLQSTLMELLECKRLLDQVR